MLAVTHVFTASDVDYVRSVIVADRHDCPLAIPSLGDGILYSDSKARLEGTEVARVFVEMDLRLLLSALPLGLDVEERRVVNASVVGRVSSNMCARVSTEEPLCGTEAIFTRNVAPFE